MGLGTWRFFLAFLVAISHLYSEMLHGPAAYAVWCFFILSGFLMVLVLTTKYGTSSEGVKVYAFNRFMRIYPPYIAAVLLALLSIAILDGYGFDSHKLSRGLGIPLSLFDWAATFGLLSFLPLEQVPIPVSWALSLEVCAYALMPLFAKSRHASILGFVLALSANLGSGFGMESFTLRYKGFATCMLAFAAGAVICHYREQLRAMVAPRASVVVWCAHCLIWLAYPAWPWTYGLLLSVPLSAWVVLSLAPIKGGHVDAWLGDLSYPVYLLHIIAGAWMWLHFGYNRGFSFFAASFILTLALSWVFVMLIDRRSNRVKKSPPKVAPSARPIAA
jgi:peptidoglycan/LPS O-acetylase OafA/YrhL